MTPARLTTYFGVKIPTRRDLLRDELKLDPRSAVYAVPPQLGLNLLSFLTQSSNRQLFLFHSCFS